MQRDKLIIRRGQPIDSEAIAEIEQKCFRHPWSAEDIEKGFESFTIYFLAEYESEIIGYCGIQNLSLEGYITNVAVLQEHRGKGVASLILEELLEFSERENLEFVTLEVRESNTPAIKLYQKMGFEAVGRRPNFYRDPREDALLMTKFIK